MKTKKIGYMGMLIALAFVLSYVEMLLPFNIGIPGAKLGLANVVVLMGLYLMGPKEALLLNISRIILVGFLFGNLSAMLYSMAGGIVSFIAMIITKKLNKNTILGVSVMGGVFHNVGQIIVAIWAVETYRLIYYLPILIIIGTVSGIFIGILGTGILKIIKGALYKTI